MSICMAGLAGQTGRMATLTASASGVASSAPRPVDVVQSVVGIFGISTNLTATSPDDQFNVYVGIGTVAVPGTLSDTLSDTQQARKGVAG